MTVAELFAAADQAGIPIDEMTTTAAELFAAADQSGIPVDAGLTAADIRFARADCRRRNGEDRPTVKTGSAVRLVETDLAAVLDGK